MSERHKLEVTVIADDNVDREELRDWVGRVLSSLEKQDTVQRTFVNEDLTSDEETRRLFEQLEGLGEQEPDLAESFIKELSNDEG